KTPKNAGGGPAPMPTPEGNNPDGKPPVIRPNDKGGNVEAVAAPLTDAEVAKLTNLLPNDTEHVFHVYMNNLLGANSPLREAVFTPGPLDDADLRKKLG